LPANFSIDYESGSDVSWSPDGRRLVFSGGPGGEDHIYVINANGSGLRQLTRRHEDTSPAWSPDGTEIAFTRGVNRLAIYLMRTDGSDQRLLTPGDEPAWSPHGTILAFELFNVSGSSANGMYAIAPGRSKAFRMGFGMSPAWSPDGRQIAFFCCSGYAESDNGVYVVDANGGRPRRLARVVAGPISLSWQPIR
jgi:TolB protein